eukprot:CAMPEP_0194772760 /NCGR_PEP_ID=MMETSP0323_2-20130528/52933_1 /TAXON_ID=2866 ORGANISM="Crypthecodinium cohnii, Strain Seligo" /NCGR_SAMPLE_ID=MMETSP0323_2 /ASSEMBLY_ACC=CAM_ASM_000346 /LENGTH=54 /DNA_ID=CAMNT_0039707457 /DNA_START=43 /DNA_END=204 /DNA_ORIENTATION=-
MTKFVVWSEDSEGGGRRTTAAAVFGVLEFWSFWAGCHATMQYFRREYLRGRVGS